MKLRFIKKITTDSKIISIIVMILTVAVVYTNAQNSYTWSGATSGDWGVSSNWDSTPAFAAENEFIFNSSGASNLSTYMGSAYRTIGGLTFNSDADTDITIRTYSNSAGTGGANKILIFDNGTEPVYITVAEGAEGNIQVAPGNGRTVIKKDLIITHNGTGLLTFHNNNWFDDEGQNRFIYKKGSGSLLFGVNGWKFGGGLVIQEGQVKILRNDAFGTGKLIMTGGALSASGTGQREFTNSYSFANTLIIGDDTDTGLLIFNPAATGTLVSNTVLNVRGNGLILQGAIGDDEMNRSLTKTGSAALSLVGANSYGGGTLVGEGRVRIGNNDAFGTGSLTVTNGTLSSNSGGARILTNNYFFSGEITTGHSLETGSLTFKGTGNLTGNTTLEVVSETTLYSALEQSGGDHSFTKTGPGTLSFTLTEINTFAGGLNVKEGTLVVNNTHDRLGTGPVTLDGGTLRYVGSTVHASIDRSLIIGDAGATIELNTNDRVISWINPVSGGGTLTKKGAGPLAFTADNTHTGQIVVTEGLLRINGTHPGEGAISVQNGGAIGGSGSAARVCNVESGGMLDPGSGNIGTFTINELVVQEGALYLWELDNSSSDTIDVDGDLSLPDSFAIDVTQISPANIKNRVLFAYSGNYSGPARATLTATGDVDAEARYETLHDSQNKQVLFKRSPDGTIIYIR